MGLVIELAYAHALLGQAELGGKRGSRLPLATLDWRHLLHHLVDLFQGKSFHLWNEEEHKGDTEQTA